MASDRDTWYVCNQPFISADPAFEFRGRKGITRVRATDPAYRRWPQFFDPITSSDRAAPPIEEAVAVPGGRRT